MGGCSAFNCSNHSRNGHRMVRFPRDQERRKIWTKNCRRQNWEPGPQAQLCIAHFEDSQFENTCHDYDGKKKLRQNAIPTLFDVPNKPASLTPKRIKGFGCPKPDSILAKKFHEKENSEPFQDETQTRIAMLEKEIISLKEKMAATNNALSSFLNEEQISSLHKTDRAMPKWSNETIIKGLKLRFALGKHGFNYLRETGYPIPSYSTLNRHIQHIQFDFGILKPLFLLLQAKVQTMPEGDKNCVLLFDEMEIANYQDFDTSTKSFVGNITLGHNAGIANHYLVAMLRGLQSPWKQVIAHELTGLSTSGSSMNKFLSEIVVAARAIGLNIRASTSDMGTSNQALWRSLEVSVTRNKRQTCYKIENDVNIHAIADVPHLIKNVRGAFLSRVIILPENVCQQNDLPSCQVSSEFVKKLWLSELTGTNSLRSLHHLTRVHLFPTHFSSMNVASAVQLFSIKTAAALEKAVSLQQIDKAALSVAWFIRLISQWFTLMTARHRKVGITAKNKQKKFEFLQYFVDVIQNTQFGKGWKPVQTGMILSSLSVIKLSEELFSEGFTFFLPGRLSQDSLENVFSQVRRKAGSKPTSLQAKGALKLICLSQFISDLKNTNYASDSDMHLLDSTLKVANNSASHIPELPDVSGIEEHQPSTSTSATLVAAEENDIYFIAGSILNTMLKRKNICEPCLDALKEAKNIAEPNVPRHKKLLTEYCDMGGLKKPESGLYHICQETEKFFKKYSKYLVTNEVTIKETLVEVIKNKCQNVILPTCCKIKEMIIEHYLVVRCKSLKNYNINKRAPEASYGSASANKKQKCVHKC